MANVGRVTIEIVTPKAIRAVLRASVLAEEIAEDHPWDSRAVELAKALKFACKRIGVRAERKKEGE